MTELLIDIIKILLAIALASLVGIEREKSGKPVGMRTLSLVCAGSTFAAMIALHHPEFEPGRVIGGIITGIGFLGAGAIIAHENNVKGLTTAATVWSMAIIGIGIGMGEYVLSIMAVLIIYIVLKEGAISKRIIEKSNNNNGNNNNNKSNKKRKLR